jgi:hypothetical protein
VFFLEAKGPLVPYHVLQHAALERLQNTAGLESIMHESTKHRPTMPESGCMTSSCICLLIQGSLQLLMAPLAIAIGRLMVHVAGLNVVGRQTAWDSLDVTSAANDTAAAWLMIACSAAAAVLLVMAGWQAVAVSVQWMRGSSALGDFVMGVATDDEALHAQV